MNDLSPDVRIAIAQIEKRATRNQSSATLGALGVAYLVGGDVDRAVATLGAAVRAPGDESGTIGGALAGVSEALALAKKAGVDGGRVRQALLGGFAASRVLEVHGQRMLTDNYKPGFRTKLYQKDLRLANEAAGANGVAMPSTAVLTQLVNALVASGGGDLDYAAVGTVIGRLSGENW